MNRTEKHQTVDSLHERFQGVPGLFLIDYQGLKVVDATELRRKIREIDGSYLVVKNTLALRAARGTGVEQLASHFEGPTAIAYHPKDVLGLAKLLTEVVKSNPTVRFKAALVEGRAVSAGEIQAIASLPPREVLLGRLISVLQAPIRKLIGVLKAPVRDLQTVLRQIEK